MYIEILYFLKKLMVIISKKPRVIVRPLFVYRQRVHHYTVGRECFIFNTIFVEAMDGNRLTRSLCKSSRPIHHRPQKHLLYTENWESP